MVGMITDIFSLICNKYMLLYAKSNKHYTLSQNKNLSRLFDKFRLILF